MLLARQDIERNRYIDAFFGRDELIDIGQRDCQSRQRHHQSDFDFWRARLFRLNGWNESENRHVYSPASPRGTTLRRYTWFTQHKPACHAIVKIAYTQRHNPLIIWDN